MKPLAASESENAVIVVGTGIGAIGVTLALLDAGMHPIVLDVGEELPLQLQELRERLAQQAPNAWTKQDVQKLSSNSTAGKLGVPRKLVMGSDYFYGQEAALPPHSFALGGFSAGWGAAYLPPDKGDLENWPVTHQEIMAHARLALRHIRVSEPQDKLTRFFPALTDGSGGVIDQGKDQQLLLKKLKSASIKNKLSHFAFGQSRLMTHVATDRAPRGSECRKCGFCMSGCVYGAIFDAGAFFKKLHNEGKLTLQSGHRVLDFRESRGKVKVRTIHKSGGSTQSFSCHRLFLAAGTVESTRIVVRSVAQETKYVDVLRTGGGILPLFSFERLPSTWPQTNTQSSTFLDIVDTRISNHWIHAQLGPSNELLLGKLGLLKNGRVARHKSLRWALFERLAVALVNLHSDHGPRYRMHFAEDRSGNVERTSVIYSREARRETRKGLTSVRKGLRDAGLHSLRFLEKDSASVTGYHLGGTLPMRAQPQNKLETDKLGRPFGTSLVHVVDASVLTSLPATTLGILILANAHRIASSFNSKLS